MSDIKPVYPGATISSDQILDGALFLVDKPYGWTSFDVVKKIRYFLCQSLQLKKLKVGHAGTLDPLATGLLLVCTGKMTKQIDGIMAQDKVYSGVFKIGYTTPSYDRETEESFAGCIEGIDIQSLEKATLDFKGNIQQLPPVFSAIKKDGVRLYDKARKGEEVKLDARSIVIHYLSVEKWEAPFVYFKTECSKGTYIRSLAFDFGQKLGCGAYLYDLRRENSGSYSVDDAWQVEDLIEAIKKITPAPL